MITSLNWTLNAAWQLDFLSLLTGPLSGKYFIPLIWPHKAKYFPPSDDLNDFLKDIAAIQRELSVFHPRIYPLTYISLCSNTLPSFLFLRMNFYLWSLLRPTSYMFHPFSRIQQLSPLFPFFFIFPWRVFLPAYKHAALCWFFKKTKEKKKALLLFYSGYYPISFLFLYSYKLGFCTYYSTKITLFKTDQNLSDQQHQWPSPCQLFGL